MHDADRQFLIAKRNGFDAVVRARFLHEAINDRAIHERFSSRARGAKIKIGFNEPTDQPYCESDRRILRDIKERV